MPKVKKVNYVGPTGSDPNLGYVVCGTEINIPVAFYDKYLNMKRIEVIEKPAKFKRTKEDK